MSNPDNDQIGESLNLRSCYASYNEHQYQGVVSLFRCKLRTSLLPMVAGIVPEATIGTADLPPEWAPNQFSFPPSYPGNLIKEAVGTYSNSTSMSSVGTQQQISPDDLQKPYEHPPMTRQDRILRYFEKKKARKYQKKVIYSSRKTYAQTRPRIRGRFARSSQTDASDKTAV
uniref:Putative CCT domain-containing protein n=1 Tax=Helianthus annuus TaxID=4232 RepID=A0A251USP7_HELAN